MSGLRARWVELQLAFVLLTRLPMGRLPDDTPPTSDAAWAFPFVGLIIGALSGTIFLLTAFALPPLTAALLAITTGIVLTGALHEDGLADVADGFGGGQTRDAKLEIMRDSRIGSYGVVALILILGLTATAIAASPPTSKSLTLFAAIGAISRAAVVIPMTFLRPARAEGLGFRAALTPGWRVWTAIGLMALAALVTFPALIIVSILTAGLMTIAAKTQIGGQTGDVLGATQKLTECTCWLTAAAYISAS